MKSFAILALLFTPSFFCGWFTRGVFSELERGRDWRGCAVWAIMALCDIFAVIMLAPVLFPA
jgi:hypothetical protein